jgi:hypothetical protein
LTRKIVTDVYQYYQLIGDLYFNTKFDKIKDTLDKQFQYLEEYYLSIINQPLQITPMLFVNIKGKNNNKIDFYDPDVTVDAVKDRLKTVLLLYIAFYYFVAPFMHPYHDYIRKHLKLSGSELGPKRINEHTLENILQQRNLKKHYTYFLIDLILQLCGEGSMEPLYKYHYTELDKEAYLLKQLDKEYKSCSANNYEPKDDNYATMIKILNNNIYYYKNINLIEPILPTQQGPEPQQHKLYTNESKAIALEYITKLDLINEHQTRMLLYKEFETYLIILINNSDPSLEKEFNNYMDLIFQEYLKNPSNIKKTSDNFIDMFNTIREVGLT